MQAKDVMTREVVTVAPDTAVAEIARTLLAHNISGAPVVDADGRVVGIVSEGDFMRRPEIGAERRPSWWLGLISSSEQLATAYTRSHGGTAAEVMTRDVVSIGEETELGKIAELLEERRIKRVPVLRDGRLVGIVSRANLLQGLVARAKQQPAPSPSTDDREIREALLQTVETAGWIRHGAFNAVVSDGVAELWGYVDSEEERQATLLAARQVPGVREVVDHLGIVPPYLRGS